MSDVVTVAQFSILFLVLFFLCELFNL